jgi:hypothetical protein
LWLSGSDGSQHLTLQRSARGQSQINGILRRAVWSKTPLRHRKLVFGGAPLAPIFSAPTGSLSSLGYKAKIAVLGLGSQSILPIF